ncbi:glycoside hydrolase family 99-like domain-containing protein, partial [Alistipes putredinis]|uniref:glycoside hydrolase family 99-like domain-containing protein n=1 Tax=Alistipes putredinis TaxID=28117 RepID=UPI004026691A
GVIPGWDRSRLAGRRATIYTRATPELFAKHLKEAVKIVSERKSDEHKIIFLRSWNEWAEGNYVEPDLKYGHGFLEAIKKNIIE